MESQEGDVAGPRTEAGTRRQNRREILEEIYERYYKSIYRYCFYRLFTHEAAEDAASTTFLRLAERIDSFNINGDTWLRNWLYGTARNAINSYIRASRRQVKVFSQVWRQRTTDFRRQSESFEDFDWPTLYKAIVRLKPRYQDLVILRFFEGFQINEIAELHNMKPVTVRVMLWRALKELKQYLKCSFSG